MFINSCILILFIITIYFKYTNSYNLIKTNSENKVTINMKNVKVRKNSENFRYIAYGTLKYSKNCKNYNITKIYCTYTNNKPKYNDFFNENSISLDIICNGNNIKHNIDDDYNIYSCGYDINENIYFKSIYMRRDNYYYGIMFGYVGGLFILTIIIFLIYLYKRYRNNKIYSDKNEIVTVNYEENQNRQINWKNINTFYYRNTPYGIVYGENVDEVKK